jgi:zinc protease
VTPDEVRILAEKSYGQVPSSTSIHNRLRPQEPESRANRHVAMADPRVAQPSLTRGYLMPSYRTAKRGEAEAIDVLVHLLGSGTLSRLNRALVMEKGIAASAGARYASTSYDMNRMTIYATPRPGVSLEELEEGVESVIGDIIANGITEVDLARAKTKLIADTIYAWDDQFTLARTYGAALATGMTVESVQTWPDRIRAVTKDQVQAAAKTWLELRRSVTGYLVKPPVLPEKTALQEKRS